MRRLQDRRNVQCVPYVKSAVSVFAFQAVRVLRLRTSDIANEVHIADAVGVGVVGQNREIVAEAMLCFEQQRLEARDSAVVRQKDIGVWSSFHRVLKKQNPSLVQIVLRRTR